MAVREQDRAPKGGQDGRDLRHAADLTGHMPSGSMPSTSSSSGQSHHPSDHPFDDSWDAEAQDNKTVPLTRAEAETLFGPGVSRPSRVTPFKVVAAQMVLSLCATLAWWLFYSPPGASAPSAVAPKICRRVPGYRSRCEPATRGSCRWRRDNRHAATLVHPRHCAFGFMAGTNRSGPDRRASP